MGANLRPRVRRFRIATETFAAGDHSVKDGCVSVGTHRLMRFDLLTENVGDADFVVGNPADHPEWFVLSASHNHYHLIDFNEYLLYDHRGNEVTRGYKQAFCTIDIEPIPSFPNPKPKKFTNCNVNQGISSGWADVYGASLDCQFIVMDGLPDGDYILKTTTNAKRVVPEDDYSDNTICTGLRLGGAGTTITEIPPPVTVWRKTSSLNFVQVPEHETTVRAIVFDTVACMPVNFEITAIRQLSGPASVNFRAPLGNTAIAPHWDFTAPSTARLWIAATAPSAGGVASGEVDVHCIETNERFTIPITLDAIARPKSATVLVLDKSGSMDGNSGDGRKRIQVLHDSAPIFIDYVLENSAVGMVSFDHDAYNLLPITVMGPRADSGLDPSRASAYAAIQSHITNPRGYTAIGDGVEKAVNLLNTVSGYDVEAIVVLTDGFETASKYIRDVQPLINGNQHIYAIGLGTAQEVQPAALKALCNGHNGYMELTGTIDTSNYFRLSKYYLQILTGISNANIILDPDGYILPGQKRRIAFKVTETDITVDVILLCPYPWAMEWSLETPDGTLIDKSMVGAAFGISYKETKQSSFFGLTLPANVGGNTYREGIWHAVLTVNKDVFKTRPTHIADSKAAQSFQAHGLQYSLNVHTYSNLRLKARLSQNSYELGAKLTINATLTEYDLPVEKRAAIRAELTRPDNSQTTLYLNEVEPGVFQTETVAHLVGIYHFRLYADGHTLKGKSFTREQTVTGSIWQGGDQPPARPGDDAGLPVNPEQSKRCCTNMYRLVFIGLVVLVLILLLIWYCCVKHRG